MEGGRACVPSGLLTWGKAAHGQLGHGRKQRTDMAAPTAVTPLASRPISMVACGHFHTVVVIAAAPSTEVHTWGRGALGLLGHGDEDDSLLPRPVAALSGLGVRMVACGIYQTAAITDRGELFCWGWRLERTSSGGAVDGYVTLPEKVHALEGLVLRHVACGHYCTAATTKEGMQPLLPFCGRQWPPVPHSPPPSCCCRGVQVGCTRGARGTAVSLAKATRATSWSPSA